MREICTSGLKRGRDLSVPPYSTAVSFAVASVFSPTSFAKDIEFRQSLLQFRDFRTADLRLGEGKHLQAGEPLDGRQIADLRRR